MNRGSGGCRIREGRVRRIRVVILLLLLIYFPFCPSHGSAMVGWAGNGASLTTQHTPSPYQFNESDFKICTQQLSLSYFLRRNTEMNYTITLLITINGFFFLKKKSILFSRK